MLPNEVLAHRLSRPGWVDSWELDLSREIETEALANTNLKDIARMTLARGGQAYAYVFTAKRGLDTLPSGELLWLPHESKAGIVRMGGAGEPIRVVWIRPTGSPVQALWRYELELNGEQ